MSTLRDVITIHPPEAGGGAELHREFDLFYIPLKQIFIAFAFLIQIFAFAWEDFVISQLRTLSRLSFYSPSTYP